MKDGIYRASLRGESTYVRAQVDAVAFELLKGKTCVESGKQSLENTRQRVEFGWHAVATKLAAQGLGDSFSIVRFVNQMLPAKTEREWVAHQLRQRMPSREATQYLELRHL
jgi:hypothetical protein